MHLRLLLGWLRARWSTLRWRLRALSLYRWNLVISTLYLYKVMSTHLRLGFLWTRLLVAEPMLIDGRLRHGSTSSRSRSLTTWLLAVGLLGILRLCRLLCTRCSIAIVGRRVSSGRWSGSWWGLLLLRRKSLGLLGLNRSIQSLTLLRGWTLVQW